MRLVVLTTSFPRDDDDPSGHFVRADASRLAREGHEVHVVAAGGSLLDAPERRGSLTIHPAGGGILFGWPGAVARAREAPWRLVGAASFAVGARARLRAIAADGPIDRVVAHWIVPSAWPLAGSIGERLDVVAHGADVRLLLAMPRPLRERVLERLLDRGGSLTFAASRLLADLEGSVRADTARRLAAAARVEPPAIDVPEVPERAVLQRRSSSLKAGERLVVTASRLVPDKRVELAIDAVEALGGAKLVVIGDGPERGALERRALAGNAVTFAGALARSETLAWIRAADVLVHPSAAEGAPTVVREARALGTPVVACDAGDIAAWAHDDPGIRVVAATGEALAAGIAEACISRRFD